MKCPATIFPVQWPLPCHNSETLYRCTWRQLGDLDNFADAISGVSPTDSFTVSCNCQLGNHRTYLIARFVGPAWGPPGDGRIQVGPMFVPWTLLSRMRPHYIAAHREIIALVASPSLSKLGNYTHKCNTVQSNLLLLISWFDVMRNCVQIIRSCEVSLSKTSRVRRKITCYPSNTFVHAIAINKKIVIFAIHVNKANVSEYYT